MQTRCRSSASNWVSRQTLSKTTSSSPGRSHKHCQHFDVKSPESSKRCSQSDQRCQQHAEQSGEWRKLDVGNDWSLNHVDDNRDRRDRDTTVQ